MWIPRGQWGSRLLALVCWRDKACLFWFPPCFIKSLSFFVFFISLSLPLFLFPPSFLPSYHPSHPFPQVSKAFDPFTFLSLPLPGKETRYIFVVVVRADPMAGMVKVLPIMTVFAFWYQMVCAYCIPQYDHL